MNARLRLLPAVALAAGAVLATAACSRSESPAPAPEKPKVTRADLAEWIVTAKSGAAFDAPSEAVFQDVPATHPRFRFVQKFAADGVTKGYAGDSTRFGPDVPATRYMLFAFLVRAKHGTAFEAPEKPAFEDVPATYAVFREIQKAAAEGLATPCRPGFFCPDDFPTPEEAKAAIALAFPPAKTP